MSEQGFDFDLIMALAAEELPPEEAAELEAGLDGAARRELASQRAARQALGRLEQPALSDWERRRLRAGVRAELGAAGGRGAAPRYRQRKVRWTRALPALAAAAALVVVVGVVRNGGRQTQATTALDAQASPAAPAPPAPATTAAALTTTTAAAPTTTIYLTTTAAAAAGARLETEAASAELAEASAAMEAVSEAQADASAAEPLLEEGGEAAAAAPSGPADAPSALPEAFDLSSEELIELAGDSNLLAGFLDDRAGGAAPFPASELEARAGQAGLACWEAVEAPDGGRVLFMGAGLIDGSEGEAYFIEEEGAAEVHLFDAPDCTNLNL